MHVLITTRWHWDLSFSSLKVIWFQGYNGWANWVDFVILTSRWFTAASSISNIIRVELLISNLVLMCLGTTASVSSIWLTGGLSPDWYNVVLQQPARLQITSGGPLAAPLFRTQILRPILQSFLFSYVCELALKAWVQAIGSMKAWYWSTGKVIDTDF